MVLLYVKRGKGVDPLHVIKNNQSIVNKFINVLPFELHLIDQSDEGRIMRASFCGQHGPQ